MGRKKMNARNQIPAHQLGTNFSNNNQNNLHHYHQNPNRKAGPRSLPSYHNNNNFNQHGASYSGHSNGYNGQPRLGIGGKFSASSRQSINSGDEMSDVSYSSSQAQPIGQLGMPGIVSHSNGHAPVRQYSRSKRRRDPNLNLPLDSIKEQDAYPTNISKINSKQNVSNVTSRTESANEVHGRRSRKEDDKISDKLNQNITHSNHPNNLTSSSSEPLTENKNLKKRNIPSREPSFNNKNIRPKNIT